MQIQKEENAQSRSLCTENMVHTKNYKRENDDHYQQQGQGRHPLTCFSAKTLKRKDISGEPDDRMENIATDTKQVKTHQIFEMFEKEGMKQLVEDLNLCNQIDTKGYRLGQDNMISLSVWTSCL